MDYDEQASLAFQPPDAVADFLEALGDHDSASLLRRSGARPQSLMATLGLEFMGSGHQFGFIDKDGGRIVPATTVSGQAELIGRAIKVTLDKFHVQSYPGIGRHRILLEIFGRNQAGDEREDLRFTIVVEANDRDSAGVSGIPIFTGLHVPADGLAFKATTVAIGSGGDDMIIDALKSQTFQSGMKLLAHVQPILPQLVALASGVTKSLLSRTLNRQVQAFQLGLDFSDLTTSCALRCGSYVVVQARDDGSWSWDDWTFDETAQTIVSVADRVVAPFNFLIFGVAESQAQEATSASRRAPSAARKRGAATRSG